MRFYPTRQVPATILRSGVAAAVLALVAALAPASDAVAATAHAHHHAAVKKSHGKAKAVATRHVKAKVAARHVKSRHTATRHASAKAKHQRTHVAARHAKVTVAKRAAPAPQPLQLVDGKPVLKASVAYVVDQDSGKVLLGVNDHEVRPIASLTKLMTGMVIAEAKLPMDERITIADADVDRVKFSSSRLRVGTVLTRTQALHLALMSSENRAAHALARTYPGGETAFVSAMNNIARQLGMTQTHYVEPTGLSPANHSSAHDLAVLADAAYDRPLLRQYTTSRGYRLASGKGTLNYVNTNRLVREGQWPIGLQKTGYIREAGQCILVQTKVMGRKIIMVLLDSASTFSRIKDAQLVKRWLKEHPNLAGLSKTDDES
jgi:D-alanyl-D-alanine endopeptidase (penicillin-binding protein 7)